jgi:hypothetical protein
MAAAGNTGFTRPSVDMNPARFRNASNPTGGVGQQIQSTIGKTPGKKNRG